MTFSLALAYGTREPPPPMVSLRGQSESGTTTSGEVLQLPASEFASVDTTGVFRKHLQLCKYPLKK